MTTIYENEIRTAEKDLTKTITTIKLAEDYTAYCENEFTQAEMAINNTNYHFNPKEVMDNAIQRMLGAGEFVQSIGLSYNVVERIFEKYKEKIEIVCGYR